MIVFFKVQQWVAMNNNESKILYKINELSDDIRDLRKEKESVKIDIERLNLKIERLLENVESLLPVLSRQPDFLPLSLLVSETGKSRQTIRDYILRNYEPDKDFKVENSKILVSGSVFVAIKEYYEKKSMERIKK